MSNETIDGTIERITFHNQDTGYCVLKVKVPRIEDLVTLLGHSENVYAGEHFKACGSWIYHKDYGNQFKADTISCYPPHTLEGIAKYLGSGLIKGIGPVYAKKLVDHCKEKVFDIIETKSRSLKEIPGFGPKRIRLIKESWKTQKFIREIMVFLHSNGVSTSKAVRIYKTYQEDAISIIQKNPYRLATDIHGIGFLSADKIAQNMGIEVTSEHRISSGIHHIILQSQDKGHCCLPMSVLITETKALLDIEEDLIKKRIDEDLRTEDLILTEVRETPVIFLPAFFYMERKIALKLKTLLGNPSPLVIDHIKCIEEYESESNISLSLSQRDAINAALANKVSIITGGPGVGKTTIIRGIIHALSKNIKRIKLAAPTGRAAKRLSESTGRNATTIHRLLEPGGHQGAFKRNEKNLLLCDCLIIDEASMIDLPLMNAIIKALPRKSYLILVGDVDQLPSVGPGRILSDLIESNFIPYARLTEIFRQESHSMIVSNSHRINQGQMPAYQNLPDDDFFFLEMTSPEDGIDKIKKIVLSKIPNKWGADPFKDIQILSPMQRGMLGARNINAEIQQSLISNQTLGITVFGQTFKIGDKVIQSRNDYDKDVFNGDIGFIKDINANSKEVLISFNDNDIIFDFGEMDTIYLAYAITIHKSQGSEFPFVVVPISMSHYPMLMRNLIYTGVTRAKKKVILVGDKKALYLAVSRQDENLRWTNLQKWFA